MCLDDSVAIRELNYDVFVIRLPMILNHFWTSCLANHIQKILESHYREMH